MSSLHAAVEKIIRLMAEFVEEGDREKFSIFDELPLAVYLTEKDGCISYYNRAYAAFVRRRPLIGQDQRWLAWKCHSAEGKIDLNDQCQMAVCIQNEQAVRGVKSTADRADGTCMEFLSFPTPIVDENGVMLGAVDALVAVKTFEASQSLVLQRNILAWQSDQIRKALASFTIGEIRSLVKEFETELGDCSRN